MENPSSRLERIITLLTDFGTHDYFVGAMKGVILSLNPEAHIVDISHDVPPQDIETAAFNLLCCYQTFPPGTIHVAVVDPGVGSVRKRLAVECAQQFFVGPDNGLFSWICEREKEWQAFQLTNDKFFRQPVSNTFHGRDIFAPIAAELSKGVVINELGEAVNDIVRLESLEPRRLDDGTIEGRVVHIDHFGNCVTNLTMEHLPDRLNLVIGDFTIRSFRRFFAEGVGDDKELFCLIGSAGFLEVAAQNDSAAAIMKACIGVRVILSSS